LLLKHSKIVGKLFIYGEEFLNYCYFNNHLGSQNICNVCTARKLF